jgi:hypothetical protein
MSQAPAEKFLYFTVGLLKDSEALEALRQDAVKHHMIENPGQLIALRLTEYYEMMNKGIVQPSVRVPAIISPVETLQNMRAENNSPVAAPYPTAPVSNSGVSYEAPAQPSQSSPSARMMQQQPSQPMQAPVSQSPYGSAPVTQVTGRMRAIMKEGDTIVSTSSNADQNADDAADYWSVL